MSIELVNSLVDDIKKANLAYYETSSPIYTDEEYDQKISLLRNMLELYPRLAYEAKMDVLDTVGANTTSDSKVTHDIKMLSLQNAYNDDDLFLFHHKVSVSMEQEDSFNRVYCLEPKIDGVSISIVYENGKFKSASTRGNGAVGEDITAYAQTICNLPFEIDLNQFKNFPKYLELRGELYISKDDFKRLNDTLSSNNEELFKTSRNAVVGTLHLNDMDKVRNRCLSVCFYEVGEIKANDLKDEVLRNNYSMFSQHNLVAQLQNWGFPVVVSYPFANNFRELTEIIRMKEEYPDDLPYEVDGIVCKVDNMIIQSTMGVTNRYPKWAIAKKPVSKKAFTQLTNIVMQVSGSGAVTPVAELIPVDLLNSTIRRCTLHNRHFIHDKDIRIGDLVQIEMAGEIVPQIIGRDDSYRNASSKPFIFPTECPACNSPLIVQEDVSKIKCINPECPSIKKGNILYFVGKNALDIRGLKVSTIDKLFRLNILTCTKDLFSLERYRDILYKQNGFGKRSVDKLLNEIELKKDTHLVNFIIGLGIPLISHATSSIIANYYKTPQAFFKALDDSLDDIQLEIPQIGAKAKDELKKYWEIYRNYVLELSDLVEFIQD